MLFLVARERVTGGLKMLTAHEFPTRNRKKGKKKEGKRWEKERNKEEKKEEKRKGKGRKKEESVRSRRNGMLQ